MVFEMSKFNSLIIRHLINFVKTRQNYIVFESSHHHLYDNSFCLFQYLKQYKKLKLFYVVYNDDQFFEALRKGLKKKQIFFVSNKITHHKFKNLPYIIKWRKILKKCGLVFITYRNFYKEFNIPFYPEQKIINLRHGQFPIKNISKYYNGLIFDYDADFYFRVGTKESIKLLPEELKKLKCKWFASGMPRNDSLHVDKRSNFNEMLKQYEVESKSKVIFCMTTLRNSPKEGYFENHFPLKFSSEELDNFNKFLKANNCLFLVKAHHDNFLSENDRKIMSLSNVAVIDDIDLENNNIFLNETFQYSDMLITDFSSVLFDYLILNKPIAYITADIEKFKSEQGLYSTDFLSTGEQIKNIEDLKKVIINFTKNIDDKEKARLNYGKLYNGDFTNSNSEQIVSLFINHKYLS